MKHCFYSLLLMVASLIAVVNVSAQNTSMNDVGDSASLETFFDGMMLSNLESRRIPGVVIAIVQDGEIVFSKGYGYADVENHIPVDPEATLFRIGSISKLFTATAVMQLVEAGELDLNTDINTYLDFKIAETYDEPITLTHLLTHTAGFEDRIYQAWAEDAETLTPIGDWLKAHPYARVRPAGSIASYSNYGLTMAGYIVERVSGMSYEDYIQQHILQPLQMNHTSSLQPLPDGLTSQKAHGYIFTGGVYIPQDFEILNIAPAGAISTTADDMTRFMLAHLQNGQYSDAQILRAETAEQMHAQIFTHHESITGMAYGFTETEQNRHRIIGHGGDTFYFHSMIKLIPDENLGVFIACNSQSCGGFPLLVFNTFMDYYYPVEEQTLSPTTDVAERANLIAGTYRSNRRSYTTAESLTSLMSPMAVTFKNNELVLAGVLRFVETTPFTFHQIDGDGILMFKQNEDGSVTQGFFAGEPGAIERVSASDTVGLNYALLSFSLLMFLLLVIVAPVIFLARLGFEREPQPLLAGVARSILAILAILSLVFMVLVVIGVTTPESTIASGKVSMLELWQPTFGGMILLTLACLGFTLLAWKRGYWGLAGRVHFTLVTLAGILLIWFVNHWNLMTW